MRLPEATRSLRSRAFRAFFRIAFFVWGAGGLATLAGVMGARHRLEGRRSALASAP